ncbi:MAG: heme ABC transporter substrate-binding protein IsdE [Eggerthellaceae bacterium]|nr:heme ABC transporter substrate-binding protein IsdE [Eggerthellaceae bacterium]
MIEVTLTRRNFLGLCACAAASCFLPGCVDQHPASRKLASCVVATSVTAVQICDKLSIDLQGIPKTAHDLPIRYSGAAVVGSPMAPDLELLASMHPTCVISPNSLKNDLQPKYRAIGAPSVFLDLRSVTGLYDSVAYLGTKFDRQEEAGQMMRGYQDFLDELKGSLQGRTALHALVLMGVPGSYIVATENSYVGSLVQMAGVENVYAGTQEEFLNANTEDMQAKDPDVILRCAHAMPDDIREMFAKEFATNTIWRHFRAVSEGRVYDLSYDYFGMSATFDYPKAIEELRYYLYGEGQGAYAA